MRLAGGDPVESGFVFGGVGRPHPGFDAVVGGGFAFAPREEDGVGVRHLVEAVREGDLVAGLGGSKNDGVFFQLGVDGVAEVFVGEGFGCFEFGAGCEVAGAEVLTEGFCRGDFDSIVGAGVPFVPGEREKEVVPGAPRDGGFAEVGEFEFAGEGEAGEAVADGEFVVERIGGLGFGVGEKLGGEAVGVGTDKLEGTLPGEAVHGHGEAFVVGGEPVVFFTVLEAASGKGEEDGIAAAGFPKFVAGGELGPVEDVADGAVWSGGAPVHETRPLFGEREEGGAADGPACERLSEIGDGFHTVCVVFGCFAVGKGFFRKS